LGESRAVTSDMEYRFKMRIRVLGCNGGIGNGNGNGNGNGARTAVLYAMTAINHVFFSGAARRYAVRNIIV